MKSLLSLLFIALWTLSLSQCVDSERGNGTSLPGVPSGQSARLVAETGLGSVTIRQNDLVLTTFRTAMPHVEGTRWHQHQDQIAVKSRDDHGPATIQLFDSRSGQELGTVMATNAANGPEWAREMAE